MIERLGYWLDRLANAGVLPSDDEEERLNKAILTLSASFIGVISFFWVGTYVVLGLWASAFIPLAYQIASALSLIYFVKTKKYVVFRFSQLLLMLLLPFVLQWSLGGFVASGGVAFWALISPLGALLFHSTRKSLPWFLAYLVLTIFSGMMEGYLAQYSPEIPQPVTVLFFVMNVLGPSSTAYLLTQYFAYRRETALAALHAEQERSERLLLNVLPAPIAERLKRDPGVIADELAEVTILFADIVGFTPLTEQVPPERMVPWLNDLFSAFDRLAAHHGLEKIRTIGDSYMVAGGVPIPRPDHAEAAAALALDIIEEAKRHNAPNGQPLRVRVGINSGPATAAVIGTTKFIYDVYGDTVNTASRMESHGLPGRIQVAEATYARLCDRYLFEERGAVQVKGKGEMKTYLLLGRKAEAPVPVAAQPLGAVP
jgi:adenylate cyclase